GPGRGPTCRQRPSPAPAIRATGFAGLLRPRGRTPAPHGAGPARPRLAVDPLPTAIAPGPAPCVRRPACGPTPSDDRRCAPAPVPGRPVRCSVVRARAHFRRSVAEPPRIGRRPLDGASPSPSGAPLTPRLLPRAVVPPRLVLSVLRPIHRTGGATVLEA